MKHTEAALRAIETPPTLHDIARTFPDSHIEEVGERREIVIYTGMCSAVYDATHDSWVDTPNASLVPMSEEL